MEYIIGLLSGLNSVVHKQKTVCFSWLLSFPYFFVSLQQILQLSSCFQIKNKNKNKKRTHFQEVKNPVQSNSVLPSYIQFNLSLLIIYKLCMSMSICVREKGVCPFPSLNLNLSFPMNFAFGFSWMKDGEMQNSRKEGKSDLCF